MYHAQRQHIILSLDALLYQLHTLSFILSPSLWPFLCRLASQFQCSKPRDLDAVASRSLRFFFANILLFNASSLWYHATQGAADGRAVVLDFVGLVYAPSRLQLLGLDFLIIFLQLVLTTIAYEASLIENGAKSDTRDMLLPIPTSPSPSLVLSSSSTSQSSSQILTLMAQHSKIYSSNDTLPHVIDLRLAPIIAHLRNPPQTGRTSSADTSLPFPNTTPWLTGTRSLPRTSSQRRREGGTNHSSDSGGSIPGGLAT